MNKHESTIKFPDNWRNYLHEVLLQRGFDAVIEKIEEYLEVEI